LGLPINGVRYSTMDFCLFAKQSGSVMKGYLSGRVQDPGAKRLLNARTQAFTLIELIIIMVIIGILTGIAVPLYADFVHKTRVERAKWDIRQIESGINIYYYKYKAYPSDLNEVIEGSGLDPWGKQYRYVSSSHPNWAALQRMDRSMRPLNSDFDLYSRGADGLSAPALSHSSSQDDVVRASNGTFVGLGADF
jgi:general secretion pathway protein G